MEDKIIPLKKYQKNKLKELKMLFVIVIFSIITAILIWNHYVERASLIDAEIPKSNEIFYNNQTPIAMSAMSVAAEFEEGEGKPILFYLYTTWCGVCQKNFSTLNEIAREFQNTDLKVIAIAIDKDMDGQKLENYLDSFGNFYFQGRYLAHKEGFGDFLKNRGIKYRGVIPFTTLIGRDGKTVVKFNGTKSRDYLRTKIIKELFKE